MGLVSDLDLVEPPNAHFPFVKPGTNQRDTSGKLISPQTHYHWGRPFDVAVIHHTSTKSYKEYVAKRLRGTSGAESNFVDMLIAMVKDKNVGEFPEYSDDGWAATKKFLPDYRLFDEII